MFIEFLLTAILIELTPGPNMAWLALLGASRGRLSALGAVAGIALGLAIAGIAAALGVSALIGTTPWLFQALRWAGSLYLIYLAWDAWQQSTGSKDEKFDQPIFKYFTQGLIGNMLNPKAYLVYAAVLPQFIDSKQAVLMQLATLTVAYVVIATVIHAGIALLSGSFSGFFTQPAKFQVMSRVFAVLLAIVAIWFFFSTGVKS
jgi:threonine/homoserine/homoserine lactone efflux protein